MIRELIRVSNKVTIEKLDAILERIPSATYADAKQALMECDGDVVEAIILIESSKNFSKTSKAKKTMEEVFNKDSEDIKELKNQVKELLKRSSVIRVIVERNSKVIVNIPLTLGVVGLALGPLYTLVGLSAAVIGKCRIKIQNEDDGSVVDLGELNEEKVNMLKNMLTNTAKEVKDVVVDKKKDDKDITDELMKEFDNQENKDDKEDK
ncbi:DUF4342 domain-containing protein [Romboutsia weinsteinii]|uniref:DUF4342 domain-containing protein n=1 Tax=Romboutsia weinsteinii TaxID=2020949 RepID=A0A371JAC9_9FIRM|nr:DUF4342 domain-containing protein [Romboutsia weinsteinii]